MDVSDKYKERDELMLEIETLRRRVGELEAAAKHKSSDESKSPFAPSVLQSAMNHFSDAICYTDPDGRIIYVNKAFLDMWGYNDASEAIGGTPVDLAVTAEEAERVMSEARKSGKYAGELEARRRDGSLFDICLTGSWLRDEDGREIGFMTVIKDITERKRAAEAVEVTSARLVNAQRLANMGSWQWDMQTGELSWSDEIYRIFGLSPQEFGATYEAFLDYVYPDDRAMVQSAVKQSLDNNAPYYIEHRVLRRDGSIRFVIEQAEVERDAKGRPIGMAGTVQDITGIKSLHERYRRIINTAHDAFWVIDSRARIIDANDSAAAMLGYSLEELLGLSINDIDVVESPEDTKERLRIIIEQGSHRFESKQRRKDGSIIDVEVSANWFRDHDGTGLLFGFIRDITERKRAFREITSLSARLDHLLNASPSVIYSRRAHGDNGATYISPNITSMLGYQPEDFISDTGFWMSVIHPDDRQGVGDGLIIALPHDFFAYEYRFKSKDGAYIWVRDEFRLVRADDGSPQELVGYLVDITDRKEAELELEAANETLEQRVQEALDRLRDANRSKDEFLANVSHELRTPLNAIIGFAEIYMDEFGSSLGARQTEYMGYISNSAMLLLRMIDNLLLFTGIITGKVKLQSDIFNIRQEVSKSVGRIQSDLDKKGLSFDLHMDDCVPQYLEGDYEKIIRVIDCLLDNAVKFTETGGIKVAGYCTGTSKDKVDMVFYVKDSGIGLTDEQAERIFMRFSQGDASSTRRFGGLGLGLALSMELLELMGGRIWFEGMEGNGSKFLFSIPLKKVVE